MKKKILISIALVIISIISIFGFLIYRDLKEENKLVDEINKIVELTEKEDIDMVEINRLADRIVTKREYAIVEEAIKEYLKDAFANIMVMHEVLNDDDLINILTIENYENDGPNFSKTLKYIKETKTTLENSKNSYKEYLTEKKVMEYIADKDLDSYYKDLYKELAIGDLEDELSDGTVENSINEVIDLLNKEEVIINFLIKNKSSWYVDGENIVFGTDSLVEEYNNLVSNLG